MVVVESSWWWNVDYLLLLSCLCFHMPVFRSQVASSGSGLSTLISVPRDAACALFRMLCKNERVFSNFVFGSLCRC
jgi:hypothetical protein